MQVSCLCVFKGLRSTVPAAPHIGHLYSLIIADTYARYTRFVSPSRRVRFVTGTDEHGMKIQKAAQERGMEPQELCDMLGQAFLVSLIRAYQALSYDVVRALRARPEFRTQTLCEHPQKLIIVVYRLCG